MRGPVEAYFAGGCGIELGQADLPVEDDPGSGLGPAIERSGPRRAFGRSAKDQLRLLGLSDRPKRRLRSYRRGRIRCHRQENPVELGPVAFEARHRCTVAVNQAAGEESDRDVVRYSALLDTGDVRHPPPGRGRCRSPAGRTATVRSGLPAADRPVWRPCRPWYRGSIPTGGLR